MNTSEILTRAADLIEERGHAKHRHVTKAGCLCTAAAMFAAVGVEPAPQLPADAWKGWTPERDSLVENAFARFGHWLNRSGIHCTDAVDWNDATDRTPAEVVSALREAARAEQ